MRFIILTLLLLLSTVQSVIAQSPFIIESEKVSYDSMQNDSTYLSFNKGIEELVQDDFSREVLYSVQYYKKVSGSRGFEDLRIIKLTADEKVQLIMKKRYGNNNPKVYTFDATQFYSNLLSKLAAINSNHFKQNFPKDFINKSTRNVILWKVSKENKVIASIFTVDIPSIAFKDNDSNFPPSVWNTLVDLDVNKLNSTPEKDRKLRKNKGKLDR